MKPPENNNQSGSTSEEKSEVEPEGSYVAKKEVDPSTESSSLDMMSVEDAATANVLERLGPLVAPENLPQVEMIVEQTISQVTHHSGPLPRASELQQYKNIDDTFAERIMRLAEKEQDFRHSIPTRVIEKDYALKSRGQHYALAVASLVLIFAGYLAYLGNAEMAGKVAICTLVGLVGVFIGGRAVDGYYQSKQENKESD